MSFCGWLEHRFKHFHLFQPHPPRISIVHIQVLNDFFAKMAQHICFRESVAKFYTILCHIQYFYTVITKGYSFDCLYSCQFILFAYTHTHTNQATWYHSYNSFEIPFFCACFVFWSYFVIEMNSRYFEYDFFTIFFSLYEIHWMRLELWKIHTNIFVDTWNLLKGILASVVSYFNATILFI